MTFRIRAATDGDLKHLYDMAKLTGNGFTNLPADRKALAAKLERSARAFGCEDPDGDELFVLVLEDSEGPRRSSPASARPVRSIPTASPR